MNTPLSPHSSLMPGPITPRSLLSASSAKQRLSMVKETTSSSIVMGQDAPPAPWGKKIEPKSPRPRTPRSATSTEGQSNRSNSPANQTRSRGTPRDASPFKGKRTKGDNLSSPIKPTSVGDLSLDLSSLNDDEQRTPRRRRSRSPRKQHNNVFVNNTTVDRERTFVKDMKPRPERATTPVNHIMTVKDVQTPRTPRSGAIASVDLA